MESEELSAEQEDLPLTDEQRHELERRNAADEPPEYKSYRQSG
jgi:hypothetical protein